jgi:peptidoglycan hydrolase-like protein with peptidoglycan-binding domain
MHRWYWAAGLTVLGLLLTANGVRADRVPSSRAISEPNPGVRGYAFVPYTTNGFSTLGVYGGVAPRVYASPDVGNPGNVQIKPVYNLPYYGAVRSFGTVSDGATSRPPNSLRP